MVNTWGRQPHTPLVIEAKAAAALTKVAFIGGPLAGEVRSMEIITAKYVVREAVCRIEQAHDLVTGNVEEVQRDEVSNVKVHVYYLKGRHVRGDVGYAYVFKRTYDGDSYEGDDQ